ncbi:MAG: type II secretion system F family protein [Planctomycetaceae bacterium]|nr:type II secretion system F family protein [Planctomycetaceae bacterium]
MIGAELSVFAYQALDDTARNVRGTIAADSPREARDKLRAQGLLVEAVSEQHLRSSSQRQLLDRPGRQAGQVASAIRDLSTLLGAGIGLVEALDTLTAQYRGSFRSSLMALRERVASGSSLSEAMEAEPWLYDELTIQMTKVGENAGTLDVVLDRLSEYRERYSLFRDRNHTSPDLPIQPNALQARELEPLDRNFDLPNDQQDAACQHEPCQ